MGKKEEKVTALKAEVFDIQQDMQVLMTQIQPVNDQIAVLDKKRLALIEKIVKKK